MPCDALLLSSAAHRSAALAQQSEALCFALLCHAACFAVLFYQFVHANSIRSVIPRTGTINTTPGLYIRCCSWITNNAPPAQFSTAIYIPQQRRAVRCRALRFAVLCRAALCVLLNIQQQLLVVVVVPGMIQIPGLCTCVVYSSFCFLQLIVLSRSPCPPPRRKYRTYRRSERDINKHTAQRRAISSAQVPLGIIIN